MTGPTMSETQRKLAETRRLQAKFEAAGKQVLRVLDELGLVRGGSQPDPLAERVMDDLARLGCYIKDRIGRLEEES